MQNPLELPLSIRARHREQRRVPFGMLRLGVKEFVKCIAPSSVAGKEPELSDRVIQIVGDVNLRHSGNNNEKGTSTGIILIGRDCIQRKIQFF